MIKNEETYCVVQHKIMRELGAWEAVVYATIANLLRKTAREMLDAFEWAQRNNPVFSYLLSLNVSNTLQV